MPKISQKSDDKWMFRCYDPSNERKGFHGWYDSLDPEIQAEIDAALEILAGKRAWSTDYFEDLRGSCAGIGEIKIDVPWNGAKDGRRKFRILVYVGPGKNEVTMLTGLEKTAGDEYSHECPKAHDRKERVIRDARRSRHCTFP